MIRDAIATDAAEIAAIYNHYVRSTVITFEEAPVSEAEMARRIDDVTKAHPWFVCETDGRIEAYAYATAWKQRSAYRYSVESTIYVRHDLTGRGLGGELYRTLVEALRHGDVHNVIGGIALPNPASVALHEKLGFRKVGDFHEVGWKLGRWVDVGYWELILNPSFRPD
jgi:L-amino acid N-acyltransferase YncA